MGDAWFAPDLQEAIRLASGLPRLLILALNGGPAYHERTASVRLDRLSALTGLTRLAMSLPILAQSPYSLDEVRKWEARLWRTERQQLSQALRSMPALEELRAEGLCLDVRDLAALPQLRRLSLGGLLLPPTPGVRSGEEAALEGGRAGVQEQPEGAEAGAEAGPADVAPGPSAALRERWPLPPQLEVLDLEGASPSLLAALVLPQSLRELGVTFPGREGSRSWPTLHLNSLDLRQRPVPIYSALRPNYDVRPETAAQLGPVLDLLAERSRGPITALSVRADADVRRGQCIVPGGHCVWLEALSRLPLEELLLEGVRLDAEADVVALTQLFPQLTVLILGTSPVLVDSMAHLSALTRLRELTLCLDLPPPCEDPLEAIERAGEALLALVGAMPELRVLHGRDQSIVGTITIQLGSEDDGPTPAAITAMLAGVAARGGEPGNICLVTPMADSGDAIVEDWEQRTLAALSFWAGGRFMESLSLSGDPQLTPAIVTAAVAAKPDAFWLECTDTDGSPGRRHNETVYGVMSILLQLGPRLTGLGLMEVGHWPPVVLQPLPLCTSLTVLDLDLTGGDAWSHADLHDLVRMVGGLRTLNSLALMGGPRSDFFRKSSLGLDRLSALTALTRLVLALPEARQQPHTYKGMGDTQALTWRQERNELQQAVRSMTKLVELRLEGMWLHVGDLAALPGLAQLWLGGLLLPPVPGVRLAEEATLGREEDEPQLPGEDEGGEEDEEEGSEGGSSDGGSDDEAAAEPGQAAEPPQGAEPAQAALPPQAAEPAQAPAAAAGEGVAGPAAAAAALQGAPAEVAAGVDGPGGAPAGAAAAVGPAPEGPEAGPGALVGPVPNEVPAGLAALVGAAANDAPAGAAAPGPGPEAAASGPAPVPRLARCPLPPQLTLLALEGASPALLTALAPPPGFAGLCVADPSGGHWPTLRLTRQDLARHAAPVWVRNPTFRLRPEAVHTFTAAVECLKRCASGPTAALCVTAELSWGCLARRAGPSHGWLPALAALTDLTELMLQSIKLSDVDVAAIVEHCPQLQALHLNASPIPVTSLATLERLTQLRQLTLCLGYYGRDRRKRVRERACEGVVAVATAAPELRSLRAVTCNHNASCFTSTVLRRAHPRLLELRPGFEVHFEDW
ncbi:hypothetical protein HYH03_016909 [Edaphochlamys debaryana]|uniref:Uncharacterized protein n=1 Tax=Edaphochlamys debaryana TaxID=47281 RepID=A0A835XNP6_9CHLO|nr:hypothetical protein HYH03_016909 [Edaphochlamys debaryana]|eukprot:KAG2484265.1 hypothetical protein HYH03_016909 [Edaphochlamys debaryana]